MALYGVIVAGCALQRKSPEQPAIINDNSKQPTNNQQMQNQQEDKDDNDKNNQNKDEKEDKD